MTVVLFEPHYDDAVLFASYTILETRPTVITVLGGDTVQSPVITSKQRQRENNKAMSILGVGHPHVWHQSERDPYWDGIEDQMIHLRQTENPDAVWVPLCEENGHEQHNTVTILADDIFPGRTRYYATYRRANGRSRTDTEIRPEPGWRALKYAAMACFSSQIETENTRPWFCSDDCLREWIA